MLDLHCHILPGLDDGAPDLADSLGIARAMVAAGYTQVAPSPHNGGGPGGDVPPDVNDAARDALQAELDREGIALQLLPNAEHMVSPMLFERLPGGLRTIGGTSRWLLVELPWDRLSSPETILFRLQSKGYRLLLAHPERYNYVEVELVEQLVERGMRMQVELGSFIDVYGSRARKRAQDMMSRGLLHVAASDVHRAKQANEWLQLALDTFRKTYGDEALRRGAHENPSAIVKDATVDAVHPMLSP